MHSTCPRAKAKANPPLAAGIGSPHNTSLPHWARRFLRQVKTLPQGKLALHQLLISVQRLMDKSAAVPDQQHSKVIKAYLLLAVVDIVERAWRCRSQQLHLYQGKLAHVIPSSREVGISFAELLQQHLTGQPAAQEAALGHSQAGYLDCTIKPAPSSSSSVLEVKGLQDLDCPAYLATLTDASLSGSWEFGYWDGTASFLPAPHSKGFSTMQLQQLLSPEVVLASLGTGAWGRALQAAATLSGVTIGRQQPVVVGRQQLVAVGRQQLVAVGRQQPVQDDAWVAAAGGRAVAVAGRFQLSSRHPMEDSTTTTTSTTSNSSSDELAISVDFLAQLYAAAAYVAQDESKSWLLPVA
eukprot:gene2744-3038_t